MCQRLVAEKAFYRMDADCCVHTHAIAGILARVVAHSAVYAGHGVVLHKHLPSLFELTLLGKGEPALDIFARGAGMVAGRQQIDVNRALNTSRPGELAVLQVGWAGHVMFFFHLSPRRSAAAPLPRIIEWTLQFLIDVCQ